MDRSIDHIAKLEVGMKEARVLARVSGISARAIAQDMKDTRVNVTNSLYVLSLKGFVVADRSTAPARYILTPLGKEAQRCLV
jgi:hypothetical protein